MGKIQEIEELVASIDDIVITDEAEICSYLFRTNHLVFLDTCFVTHQSGYQRQTQVYEALGHLCGGADAKDVVFVLTEMVLYEMRQSSTGQIYEQPGAFLRGLKDYGYTIVLVKEENVLHMVLPYVQRTSEEWNGFLMEGICSNKALWTSIVGKTKNPEFPFYDVFSPMGTVPGDRGFIHDFIVALKEKKASKDSLAEELIFLYILFLRVLLGDAKRKCMWFLSDDFSALARMKQILVTLEEGEQCNYEGIHSFRFMQYMHHLGMIQSKEELLDYLSGFMNEKVTVVVEKEPPFHVAREVKTLHECAELIYEHGEKLTLVGKGSE